MGFKLSYLVKGFPGHPLHPPLTDATIGSYTAATGLGAMDAAGGLWVDEGALANGWWLALVFGLVVSAPTAVSGLIDWFGITRGTPLWRTATSHMVAMLIATILFAFAAITGHDHYVAGATEAGPLALTFAGFGVLTLGGWLGGTIVFRHGTRVLSRADEPARSAVSPAPPEE
jgi:uncharacterized membrane protein